MKHYITGEYIDPSENVNLFSYAVDQQEPPHTHEFIEIVYILSGRGRHSISHTWYPVRRGDLLFITPDQIHSFENIEHMTIVNCLIDSDFFHHTLIKDENALQILSLSSVESMEPDARKLIPVVHFKGSEKTAVETLIFHMHKEFTHKQRYYKSALHGHLLVLLSKIFRAMETDSQVTLTQLGHLTPELLTYIEENLNRRLTLEELAKKCFYSPAYFSKVFKAYCGMSLTEYLIEKRMSLAQEYLLNQSLSIEAISRAVGYSDRQQFYQLFRAHTGMSPGAYRLQAAKSPSPVQIPDP